MTTLIYIWGVIEGVKVFFIILSVAFLLMSFIKVMADTGSELEIVIERLAKIMFSASLFFAMCATLTPSKETFAAMIIVPEIAKSDAIRKDLPEIYDMAVKKIKDELVVEVKK